ncbi:O-methyltransferase [Niabella sp. 22666]|uniref:O-methyltransferase n=1 Tax=Niabella sp. 22666 TaxID=3453954 RepID=UPI003F862F86
MVYSPLQAAAKYFKYYVHAANSKGHGMHSPFVYEFITKVMNDFTKYEDYEKVEQLRKQLLADPTELLIEDMGAGSSVTSSNTRTIASIAKNAAKPKKFGQLLYRMAKFYRPQTILELGTSLGITSSYLALGNPSAKVITMEGASGIAEKAGENFQQLNIQNIELVRGNFDSTLAGVLSANQRIDLAFIDGNHRQEPTERYFHQLLPHVHNDTLLIFDDIHWSKGMEAAWKNIVQHEAVSCDIDLFYIGIISFRKEFKEKQSFSVRV